MRKQFTPRTIEQLAETWPAGLDHISASSMSMFMRCPEQWRQRYCLDLKSRPSAALVWGRADHEAIAWNFQNKIDTGDDAAVEAVQDRFAETFQGEIDNAGGAHELEWDRETLSKTEAKRRAGTAKDQGVKLVTAYRTEMAPFIRPLAVEVRFEVPTPGLPVRIDGYIDVDTDEAMIERKTTGSNRTKPNPDWTLQGRIYQLVKPKPLEFHLSNKKTLRVVSSPELTVPADPTEEQAARTVTLLSQTVRTIGFYYQTYGPDHPWPGAITHPWACGYCGYREACMWMSA